MKSRKMRLAGHAACLGQMKNAYNISVGKPEKKNHLEDLGVDVNIRMDLREIGWKGVEWIHLAQDRDQW
jgi:hypothetical protein